MRLREIIQNAGGKLERLSYDVDQNAYGYLFRDLRLNPWRPGGSSDPEQIEQIFQLSKTLYGASGPNKKIPAGYAYFGQFITHDLTFAVTPFDRRFNRRTPRFDLDCVYAGGRETHPYLYELRDPDRLLIGSNEFGEPDLPRNVDRSLHKGANDTFTHRRSALIGDPRNDENVIVAQLHLAFLRLHNRLLDRGFHFHEAQRITRWSYQHAVIDFLRRVCGPEVVADVMGTGNTPNLKYFITRKRVYMPVEFSFAAFRMGHSMLGDRYHLNDHLQEVRNNEEFLLFGDVSAEWSDRNAVAQHTLEGQRALPEKWTIQWDRFVGESPQVQPSQLIDHELAPSLLRLPIEVPREATDDRDRSLAYRTLLRGWRQRLPSGQKVAELMGAKVLTPVGGDDPLWVYVLREAEEAKDEDGVGGTRLGPVGARIVAEVCVGLLRADDDPDTGSYYARRPDWTPWSDLGLEGSGAFGLEDLLVAAGMPITRAQWDDWIRGDMR